MVPRAPRRPRRHVVPLLGIVWLAGLSGARADQEAEGGPAEPPADEAGDPSPARAEIERALAQEQVSVSCDDAPLLDVLATLQDAAWVNLVLAPEADAMTAVTLEAERRPLGEVLAAIRDQTGLERRVWCDVLYLHPPEAPPEPPPEETLEGALPGYTVNLAGRPASDALELLAELSGLEFAVPPAARRRADAEPLTLRLRNLPLHHVLTVLTRQVGLVWERRGEVVHFAPAEGSPDDGPAGAAEARVSVSLEEAPFDEAVTRLSDAAGVTIRVEGDVAPERSVSLELADATLRRALDELVAGTGLAWRLDGQAVVIHSRPGKW